MENDNEPIVVDANKVYRYRNGTPARVLLTDRPGWYAENMSVLTMCPIGNLFMHNSAGVAHPWNPHADLIEVNSP